MNNQQHVNEKLRHWCTSLSVEDRLQEFAKLSEEDRTTMVLPENNRLGLGYYPKDWEGMMKKAVGETQRVVNGMFRNSMRDQGQSNNAKRRRLGDDDRYDNVVYHQESDDYDSDAAGSDEDVYGGHCEEYNEVDEHHNFVDMLRYCVPLLAGFHLDQLRGVTNWCYCPCSGKLSNWIDLCGLRSYFEHFGTNCKAKQKMSPNALISHQKEFKKKGCRIHALIYAFLETLYENYIDIGVRHIAFENPESNQYKKAKGIM